MISVRSEGSKIIASQNERDRAFFLFRQDKWHYHYGEFFCWFVFEDRVKAEEKAELAKRLFEQAKTEFPKHNTLLLRTGIDEDDAFRLTLEELGFRPYRHVYMPSLDVTSFDLSTLEPFVKEVQELGFEIHSLASLGLSDEVLQKFRALRDPIYAQGSGAVPATPDLHTFSDWKDLIVNEEDFIPDACFIATKEGEFAAFLNGYNDEEVNASDAQLETSTAGSSLTYRKNHRVLMLALWCYLIRYAKENGFASICAEIDSDDAWILGICAELPFVQGKDYISLVRVVNWQLSS